MTSVAKRMAKCSLLLIFLLFYLQFQSALLQTSNQLAENNSIILMPKKHILNNKQNFCIFEIFKVEKSAECTKAITFFRLFICNLLIIIGTLANGLSFIVFLSSDKKSPRILSKNILLLLTISNSIYLILYWYMFIFNEILLYQKTGSSNLKFHFNKTFTLQIERNGTVVLAPSEIKSVLRIEKFSKFNSNEYVCKIMNYFYKVFLFINSSMTVIFSLERALAINAPIKMRKLREKYRFLFNTLIAIVILYCFSYPIYYLFVTNISSTNFCVITQNYESVYMKLTIMLKIQTLALPFLLITVSNILILVGIERNRRNLHQKCFQNDLPTTSIKSNQSNQINGGSISNKSISSDKKMRITKIFIAISVSFVLLRFPYFIAWCRFSIFKVSKSQQKINQDELRELRWLRIITGYTEILQLFDYAVTGLLYFAIGKSYRQNLHAVIRCCFSPFAVFFHRRSTS